MANVRGIKRERPEDSYMDGRGRNEDPPSVSPTPKRGKFERSFVPSWLDRFEWLMFDSARNVMFCDLCRKYRKNNAFTEGCQNFRRDNLNKHVATNDHKFCVEQENVVKTTASNGQQAHPHPERPTSRPIDITDSVQSPLTPGRHSSTDSSRSSGIFSTTCNSLPQSPASLPLPSPPTFASVRAPSAPIHAPVPLLPIPPLIQHYMDPRFHYAGELHEVKLKESLSITPNYLANPPFPYLSGSTSYRPVEPAAPTASASTGQKVAISRDVTPPASTPKPTNGHSFEENELVLKVRVANSLEQDFIEIEVDKTKLSFDYVLSTVCRELSVNTSLVHKLRKLPNTIVRKDKDVKRFVDFQELELVLSNRANGDASRSTYGPSVSPRHVDVVY